ncbi:hypothetical protein U7537_13930 [Lacticaseibacillus rhamnosus]
MTGAVPSKTNNIRNLRIIVLKKFWLYLQMLVSTKGKKAGFSGLFGNGMTFYAEKIILRTKLKLELAACGTNHDTEGVEDLETQSFGLLIMNSQFLC